MKVIAFVGPSGTGKSYRAISVSRENGADAIIDDGLLISQGRVIAGTSAKKEPTKIASVKHALFMNEYQIKEVTDALNSFDIQCVMILGTSDGMVKKIAHNLGIEPIEQIVRIEDIATDDEMDMALRMRREEGKHVIPVPTFEIKQDFSGYFIHPLRYFLKNRNEESQSGKADKSIVRPTFSYMGDYTISDNVIKAITVHEANKIDGIGKVLSTNVRKTKHGIHIDMTISVKFGHNIGLVSRQIQDSVRINIEKHTSINARRVNILVKGLVR